MIRKKYVTIPWILEQERILRTKNTTGAVNWFNILAVVFLCFIVGVLLLRFYDAKRREEVVSTTTATPDATPTDSLAQATPTPIQRDRNRNMLFFNLA